MTTAALTTDNYLTENHFQNDQTISFRAQEQLLEGVVKKGTACSWRAFFRRQQHISRGKSQKQQCQVALHQPLFQQCHDGFKGVVLGGLTVGCIATFQHSSACFFSSGGDHQHHWRSTISRGAPEAVWSMPEWGRGRSADRRVGLYHLLRAIRVSREACFLGNNKASASLIPPLWLCHNTQGLYHPRCQKLLFKWLLWNAPGLEFFYVSPWFCANTERKNPPSEGVKGPVGVNVWLQIKVQEKRSWCFGIGGGGSCKCATLISPDLTSKPKHGAFVCSLRPKAAVISTSTCCKTWESELGDGKLGAFQQLCKALTDLWSYSDVKFGLKWCDSSNCTAHPKYDWALSFSSWYVSHVAQV